MTNGTDEQFWAGVWRSPARRWGFRVLGGLWVAVGAWNTFRSELLPPAIGGQTPNTFTLVTSWFGALLLSLWNSLPWLIAIGAVFFAGVAVLYARSSVRPRVAAARTRGTFARRWRLWLRRGRKRLWRRLRLYLPWDYEARIAQTSVDGRNFARLSDDRQEFWFRFGDAFPGMNDDLLTLSGTASTITRLNILLRWPVRAAAEDDQGRDVETVPFYWLTGNGDMHFNRYCQYKRDVILINDQEIRPTFLAAVGGRVYWQNFVYIEGSGLPQRNIPGELARPDADEQACAIYNHRIVSYGEYQDGSYLRRGRPRRFTHRPDPRVRSMRPTGLLIVPWSAAANHPTRDETIAAHIAAVINDKSKMRDFADYLLSLPKQRPP